MVKSRRRALRVGLPVTGLAFVGLVLGFSGLRVSHAEGQGDPDGEIGRQVTVFAILASPEDITIPGVIGPVGSAGLASLGSKAVDSKLAPIQAQLNRLLPYHGFRLLDAQSVQIVAGEAVECDLGHGYTAETTLVRPFDENGKVELRCDLSLDRELQFSATVRTPINQLFFCERPFLTDGSKLLIGVGAR